jgi:hypothetical protein
LTDDDAELSFGFGVAHGLLSAAMEREDVLTKKFLKPLVDDYKFEKIRSRFEFYSASFGQKDDAEQWNDYAAGGSGVALGLALPSLTRKTPSPKKPFFSERSFMARLVQRCATQASLIARSQP